MILARLAGFLASGGRNLPGLLDPQGFVMMYIKTDGAKKFFMCQECAEGCEVRVYLEWERRPP